MSYKFSTTPAFDKGVKLLSKKFPSIGKDLRILKEELLENPKSGDSLGKNCYKVRMQISSKGKGKSGGARVITCVIQVSKDIYLLDIYDKGDKVTISESELSELLSQINL
jgi:mRNA-degrading endonuclease RelE of RelBE toxin-antitoxin system